MIGGDWIGKRFLIRKWFVIRLGRSRWLISRRADDGGDRRIFFYRVVPARMTMITVINATYVADGSPPVVLYGFSTPQVIPRPAALGPHPRPQRRYKVYGWKIRSSEWSSEQFYKCPICFVTFSDTNPYSLVRSFIRCQNNSNGDARTKSLVKNWKSFWYLISVKSTRGAISILKLLYSKRIYQLKLKIGKYGWPRARDKREECKCALTTSIRNTFYGFLSGIQTVLPTIVYIHQTLVLKMLQIVAERLRVETALHPIHGRESSYIVVIPPPPRFLNGLHRKSMINAPLDRVMRAPCLYTTCIQLCLRICFFSYKKCIRVYGHGRLGNFLVHTAEDSGPEKNLRCSPERM